MKKQQEEKGGRRKSNRKRKAMKGEGQEIRVGRAREK